MARAAVKTVQTSTTQQANDMTKMIPLAAAAAAALFMFK
jgi:hypothetical protein